MIDFTQWTDMLLIEGERFASSSPNGPGLVAEIQRRKSAGIWMTDGSKERVEALIKSSRGRKMAER